MIRPSRYDAPVVALLVMALLVVMFGFTPDRRADAAWSDEELVTLRSLSLASLAPLAADPSNRYGDDPRAAALGEKLFFDERLSSNGKVSCGSCHLPGKHFQDGVALAQGVGTTTRRTMPIAGTAHGEWMFWDGRKDSQWSQALGPLESPVEHGGDRTQYAQLIASAYRTEYESIFGAVPDMAALPAHAGPNAAPEHRAAWEQLAEARRIQINRIFANIGKAIAAFERRIGPEVTRFDRYVEALAQGATPEGEGELTDEEIAGLRLFIGKASCTNCHNGALLADDHFHNTGVPAVASLPEDLGRAAGVKAVLADEFNCLGRYSDARPEDCGELQFVAAEGEELVRAFKTPSLRNVAARAPYMHAGQVATLEDVVRHYSSAPDAPAGHSELVQLNLTPAEQSQLAAFLRALSTPATDD
jgi:cytochrome c peroxidase